jgi:hypothetical protein
MTLSLQAGIKYFSPICIALHRKNKPYLTLQVHLPLVLYGLTHAYDECLHGSEKEKLLNTITNRHVK